MTRSKTIAVIKLGYSATYAFEDTAAALEFMAILAKAVQVDHEGYSMRDDTPCIYFVSESETNPELTFVPSHKFNTEETPSEAKERFKREKADREDVDQKFREAAPALPSPTSDDEIVF